MTEQERKRAAAEAAVELVSPGMVVGLGHGSTARYALVKIAELLHARKLKNIVGIPCSAQVAREAGELGIPLGDLNDFPQVDLTIDGADEVDPQLNVIKGGGGAFLREKIVAQASRREIIVVDERKLSRVLGNHAPVPVEIVPFAWKAQVRFLEGLGARAELRRDRSGSPWVTDQGNWIVDCWFGPINDPRGLARALEGRAGVVEHGLFLGLATEVFVGTAQGVRLIEAPAK